MYNNKLQIPKIEENFLFRKSAVAARRLLGGNQSILSAHQKLFFHSPQQQHISCAGLFLLVLIGFRLC